MAEILVVDDEINIIKSFKSLLSGEHAVYGAPNRRKTMDCIHNQKIDFIFLDFNLAGENGLELLKEIKEEQPDIYIIMISGQGNFEVVIQAISLGAYDYLEKPLDIDKIELLLKRVIKSKKLKNVVSFMVEEQVSFYNLKRIIGKSEAMQDIYKQIGLLLNKDISVLITGDNGTGKELIARALHYGSERKEEPFVAINCSGLTETLLDNELFGHERQAFTGAVTKVKGKFETAGEGTLFLDEIGEMSLSFQVKFLRVLQEREFYRLGGNQSIKLKARIVTATNIDIEKEVKEGRFRQDLFYRVNVARIMIPPLRDRREDIPLMLDHFVKEANHKLNKKIEGASEKVITKLKEYNWPGNVRELENIVINMCINTHENVISMASIPDYISNFNINIPKINYLDIFLKEYLDTYNDRGDILSSIFKQVEQKSIKLLQEKYGNNKSRIARELGISRVTLAKKMKNEDV